MKLTTLKGHECLPKKKEEYDSDTAEKWSNYGYNKSISEYDKVDFYFNEEYLAKELWVSHCTKNHDSTMHFMSQSQVDDLWLQVKSDFRKEFTEDAKSLIQSVPNWLSLKKGS